MRGISILAALGTTILVIVAPDLAGAATVEVTVESSTHSIVFTGGSGEVNTVSLGVVGPLGDPTTYSVTDATAPIVAGAGCSGGGPAGSTATCPLPRSATSCLIRGCPPVVPVTDVFEIDLGDGDDSLDSTGLPANDGGTGSLAVHGTGGPGADGFVDGSNSATFDPGTGADHVITGGGFDYIHASTGSPDEPDVYDFGSGLDGTLEYRAATYPVNVSLDGVANDGGEGEGDQVIGAPAVAGGAADDTIVGTDDQSVADDLTGAGGDDVITGGAGDDTLEGDSGDDTMRGETGNDRLFGDSITAPGDGDDTLSGGSGKDFLEGFKGRDRLRGGSGSDLLTGDTSISNDGDRDLVDCGPSRDRLAYVGDEDQVRRCERVRTSSH